LAGHLVSTATSDVVTLRAQPLTAEAFAPYGEVLEQRGSLRPVVDTGRVSVERVRLAKGRIGPDVQELARHDSYDQVFVELEGRLVLVVAPAVGPDATALVDYDATAAFVLEPGDVAMVRRGVWHITVPVTDVAFVNVTRRDDDEDTTGGEAGRHYIANVNTLERDGRLLRVVDG
jgi:ureidoglycolate lyase